MPDGTHMLLKIILLHGFRKLNSLVFGFSATCSFHTISLLYETLKIEKFLFVRLKQ